MSPLPRPRLWGISWEPWRRNLGTAGTQLEPPGPKWEAWGPNLRTMGPNWGPCDASAGLQDPVGDHRAQFGSMGTQFGNRGVQFGDQGPNWAPGAQLGSRVPCGNNLGPLGTPGYSDPQGARAVPKLARAPGPSWGTWAPIWRPWAQLWTRVPFEDLGGTKKGFP